MITNPNDKLTALKHLANGRPPAFVAAALSCNEDDVTALGTEYGWPDRERLRWAVNELTRQADVAARAAIPTTTIAAAPAPTPAPARPQPMPRPTLVPPAPRDPQPAVEPQPAATVDPSPAEPDTKRPYFEMDVDELLALKAQGLTTRQLADQLGLTVPLTREVLSTVQTLRRSA